MRKSLAILTFSVALAPTVQADWCERSRELAREMSLDGVQRIEVVAVSVDLIVRGKPGLSRVQASGEACVRREDADRIDEIEIVEEREGGTLRVIAEVPYIKGEDWRIGGLDLDVIVPSELPVSVTDTSGDMEVQDVYSLELTDSSGDVTIRDVATSVHIDQDSSGDLDIRDVGDLSIDADSSGDIEILRAATVNIGKDSSGGIYVRDVAGDLRIGRDSSGSIDVVNIGGNFTVERDTSGGIEYEDVLGEVRIPDDD